MRLGTVASVDHAQATCRVKVGDIETGDLPWLAGRAGAAAIWSPPTVGEQVLLLCPEGDHEAGLVLPGLFSNANPAPASGQHQVVLTFGDGTSISYDMSAHALEATIAAGGTVSIIASGGLNITGPVAITGTLSVTETVTADGDVIGGGKSLKSHKHSGVQSGGAVSGSPV